MNPAKLDPSTLATATIALVGILGLIVVLVVALVRPAGPVTGACTTLDLRTKSVSARCRTVDQMLDWGSAKALPLLADQ